jgi:hypothetical protein
VLIPKFIELQVIPAKKIRFVESLFSHGGHAERSTAIRPVIAELQAAGATSLRAIAVSLNEGGTAELPAPNQLPIC